MCCVRGQGRQLVVMVFKDGTLRAYDLLSSEFKWEARKQMSDLRYNFRAGGVTTDGRNNLYVIDSYNQRVHKLSAQGSFVSTVVVFGEQHCSHIRWVNKFSSLVLVFALADQKSRVHFVKCKVP